MEGLLSTYINLLLLWSKNFSQRRILLRAVAFALSFILTLGRKTISRTLCAAGLDQVDWTSAYRFFSRRLWSPRVLFRPVLAKARDLLQDETFVTVAYDDTLVRKTGKRIKGSSWQRDPLSPHFNINLVWGMRYLQASLLVPLYRKEKSTPPRGLPVQFEQLPKFKKPKKKASEEEWAKYRELIKKYNTSTTFVKELRFLRNQLDLEGLHSKALLAVCDGSFCNRTCFTAEIPRTEIIARARKNARLYHQATNEMKTKKRRGKKSFYDPVSFTPEEFRQKDGVAYKTVDIFYGGAYRSVRYKEIKNIFWK